MDLSHLQMLQISIRLTVILILTLVSGAASGQTSDPPDAAGIRGGMERLIGFLDSGPYAQAVSWEEHVVLAYELARGGAPTPLELFLLSVLRDDIGLTRSDVLSIAMRGRSRYPTWAQCRTFLTRVDASRFRTNRQTRNRARRLATVPRREIARAMLEMARTRSPSPPAVQTSLAEPVPGVVYNTYFGYLHAHSELSDGEGDPLDAYLFAREQGGLDFFGLTDHGILLAIWPWQHKWEQLVQAAEETYDPGAYVTLFGFEWSNPILGHMNIMNTRDFTSFLSEFGLSQIYNWIAARPEAFARFNHPGDYDFIHLEFFHLKPYPDAVPQLVGIETWNGTESFDVYFYDGSWSPLSKLSYWDVGNRKGWYLGALGGQDNHSPHWGIRNDFRTAVLAESLTREQIVDAYMNRRFYATEDKDLHLDLRCQGYPMGSRLTGVTREFVVTAWDGSGDGFEEVRLYRNGRLIQRRAVSGGSIEASFKDWYRFRPAYYYVVIRQIDDNDGNGRNDEAISSPIWIQ